MADLYYYTTMDYEDDPDEADEGGQGDGETTQNPDDLLPPVEKLEKYVYSENVFNRQVVARNILDTIRSVADDAEDFENVLNLISRLADDREPSVRSELMEQVPHIAMYCQEMKSSYLHVVPQYLLPMVVKFLTDMNNQVRKTSQAALLVLLEQGLVERSDVQQQVCPVIIELIEAEDHDDYRTEAVALLSKMAPLIGKDIVEKLFLERFALLCLDPLFHVRKVCAANFGDFSSVVGSESTESVLLRKFFSLCEDDVWGVRKACAEVFMPLSCVCSPAVRQFELSPLFVNLLRDQSRWVRMAAFQALGPFISTFADSSITKLLHNDNGEIVVKDHESLSARLEELEADRAAQRAEKLRLREEQVSKTSTTATEPSSNSNESNNESVIDPSRDSSLCVEPMDENSSEDSASKHVASTSGDLSAEEKRAEAYLKTTSSSSTKTALAKTSTTTGATTTTSTSSAAPSSESSNSSESQFNQFLFWRDPPLPLDVPSSDDKSEIKGGDKGSRDRLGDAAAADDSGDPIVGDLLEDDDDEDDDDDDDGWNKLPIITFQTFDDLTSDSADDTSTMEKRELLTNHMLDKPPQPNASSSPNSNSANTSSSSQSTFDPRTFDVSAAPHCAAVDPALPRGPPAVDQEIVPQLLIDHFVSMTDPSRAQTVDSDIARHCAFSLPAVALTLGRSNWPLLKDTYETLACDMQWKVRRTLASSIHELGAILGEEVSAVDLIPVFNGFLKDLDEVRIGVLKHLSDFLALLDVDSRREYLPKLPDFLKMDNERNWRFRLELTEQLERLLPLFSPADVDEHISPMVMVLIRDKVASVRESATEVLTAILRALNASENPELAQNLVRIVVEAQAMDGHWVHRQTFAALVYRVHSTAALPLPLVNQCLLPPLLSLAEDKVPNVRLGVARTLSLIDAETDYYKDNQQAEEGEAGPDRGAERDESSSRLRIETVEMNLKNDSDADVRAFYGGSAKQYGVNVAGNSNLNDDEDDEDVYGDEDEHDDEDVDRGAGEAVEAAGGDGEEDVERVVPDKWEEEAEEEEEKNRSDETTLGDKPDARPDEE